MRKGYEGISDFIFMEDPLEVADIILIPGGSHKQLAEKAADLYLKGYAKYILVSGGSNKKLVNHETECDFLNETLLAMGVKSEFILKENKATHTFENAQFSHDLCQNKGLKVKKAILVCKNFHSRRAYITYKINFPKETEILVCPVVDNKNITKDNWMENEVHRDLVMGEVYKIGNYFKAHLQQLI
ncbi:MAG: YdcF family protein [Clostridia bacterium]|nr:YdcF family protein [Clostridia bacterium]